MINQVCNKKIMRFVMISNICFEPYMRRYLEKIYGGLVEINMVPLEELESSNHIEKICNAEYIMVLINLEEKFPALIDNLRTENFSCGEIVGIMEMQCEMILKYLISKTAVPIFWFLFEDYGISGRNLFGSIPLESNLAGKLNNMLYNLKVEQIIFIDIEYIVAKVGLVNAYDIRGKYRWNSPYSKELILEMVAEIEHQIKILNGETKKCVVVDCDNVLWGGIISEDGVEKIKLSSSGVGKEYQDFQQYLKLLYDYGIMLAVCSKNDFNDVYQMFKEHNAMILKEEHISCFCVNWNNKTENLKTIADQLNIGLNSIIFVDDMKFEVQAVRMLLPEVTSILYNRNTIMTELSKYIGLSDKSSYRNAMERQMTYTTDRKRMDLYKRCLSYEDYINSLEIKIDIHLAIESEYNRISELTQRANQCTNGIRYSVNDIRSYIMGGGSLYAVYVKDKYSDLGLVGIIGVKDKCLMLFVLSCRALGRNIEKKMLDFIASLGWQDVRFLDTGKNTRLKKFFSDQNISVLTD